jgi:hypothetical protein
MRLQSGRVADPTTRAWNESTTPLTASSGSLVKVVANGLTRAVVERVVDRSDPLCVVIGRSDRNRLSCTSSEAWPPAWNVFDASMLSASPDSFLIDLVEWLGGAACGRRVGPVSTNELVNALANAGAQQHGRGSRLVVVLEDAEVLFGGDSKREGSIIRDRRIRTMVDRVSRSEIPGLR